MRAILFVCTANICRSPMAEGVARKRLAMKRPDNDFEIDSAGTQAVMAGRPPFPAAMEAAKARGYDLTSIISRQVRGDDFDRFDLILGMDRGHLAGLRAMAPTRCKHKIELFLDYGDEYHGREVPDPYGGDAKGYELALDMIEDGCRGLVELLAR
jgi:protein-tyrosine phosphatase